MRTCGGSGCRSREKRRPGNSRRRDDGRCAVDLDDRHTVQVAHSEDQTKSGILGPAAVRKAHRRAEILPRLIVIPHAVACGGAKCILSFCAARFPDTSVDHRQRLRRAPYIILRTAELPVGPSVLDRLEMLVRNER